VALAADVQEKQQSQEICAVSDAAKTTQALIEDDDTPAPTMRDVRHLAEVLGAISDQRMRPVGLANGQGINSLHGKEADR
jgi:hypothetical protein